MTSGLAERYATAVFDLANESDALDRVARDLLDLSSMLKSSDDLRRMIKSPLISTDVQVQAITALAERCEFDQLTTKFLGLVAIRRRLFALSEIIDAYQRMLARHRGEVRCEVVSAVELSDTQVSSIKEGVAAFAGKDVTLDMRTDPELLGGLVVRLGSRMFDASLRTKLRNLEHSMRGLG